MSDDVHRLDLIQRYAQQLGQSPVGIPPVMSNAAGRKEPPEAEMVDHPRKASGRLRNASVTVNFEHLDRLGFIHPDGGRKTKLVEQFQIIKRPLIQKARAGVGRNCNVVLVTSAQPGEGKSFVALNLAMSIASEHDLFVMLVDGDFYRQSLPETLGVSVDLGLADLLLDENLDMSDVMLRTNIANLTFLPAGHRRPHSTELLSSQRMTNVMNDLSSRYPDRVILVDSPPVLACSETAVLASHAGQVVMVIEQNRTGWQLAERSLAQLSDCRDISFVLNKVEPLWERDFAAYVT